MGSTATELTLHRGAPKIYISVDMEGIAGVVTVEANG
jgi:hypothetical protein